MCGISFANVGRWRQALIALNRAMQLDPRNQLAREQLWSVHRQMDLNQVVNDPDTLAQVNFEFCLERVGWLLLQSPPKPEQLAEAKRLNELVATQRPALKPRCDYWRSVALLHERRYEEAAAALEAVLTAPGGPAENPTPAGRCCCRRGRLALFLHPQMQQRLACRSSANRGGAWKRSPQWSASWR